MDAAGKVLVKESIAKIKDTADPVHTKKPIPESPGDEDASSYTDGRDTTNSSYQASRAAREHLHALILKKDYDLACKKLVVAADARAALFRAATNAPLTARSCALQDKAQAARPR